MNSYQIEALIKQAPLGTMMPLIADIEGRVYVVLALKESGTNIRLLGKKVKVFAYVAPIPIDNVIIVRICIELPDWPGNQYECFYNYHANPHMLDIWINQEVQPIQFFTKEGRKRMIGFSNELIGEQLSAFQEMLIKSPAWTMDDFDKAKTQFYKKWKIISVGSVPESANNQTKEAV